MSQAIPAKGESSSDKISRRFPPSAVGIAFEKEENANAAKSQRSLNISYESTGISRQGDEIESKKQNKNNGKLRKKTVAPKQLDHL